MEKKENNLMQLISTRIREALVNGEYKIELDGNPLLKLREEYYFKLIIDGVEIKFTIFYDAFSWCSDFGAIIDKIENAKEKIFREAIALYYITKKTNLEEEIKRIEAEVKNFSMPVGFILGTIDEVKAKNHLK